MFDALIVNETIVLAALAGVLAVDERAGWQSLLPHPVFVAAVVGVMFDSLRPALSVGVVLELVWMSILPMRGTRRPHASAGAIVGVATTCTLMRMPAGLRETLVPALGVLAGLVVGEGAGALARWLDRIRQARLAGLRLPDAEDLAPLARRLLVAHTASLLWHGLLGAAFVALSLPVSIRLATRCAEWAPTAVERGAGWWMVLLPGIGVAALIQNTWHRHLSRFLLLSAAVVFVVLWMR